MGEVLWIGSEGFVEGKIQEVILEIREEVGFAVHLFGVNAVREGDALHGCAPVDLGVYLQFIQHL